MTGSTYLRLEVISGNATGDTIVVDDELVIGRHAEGAGRLSEDEEISRQHARISREATGDYAIEDLGSSNGTFINGLRIQSPRLLALGDSIEAGATTLVVRAIVQPQPAAEAAPQAAGPPAPDRHSPTVFARSPVVAPVPAAEQSTPPSTAIPSDHTPPLALKLEIDFDAREAQIALGEGDATVRLVLEDGRWQAARAEPDADS